MGPLNAFRKLVDAAADTAKVPADLVDDDANVEDRVEKVVDDIGEAVYEFFDW